LKHLETGVFFFILLFVRQSSEELNLNSTDVGELQQIVLTGVQLWPSHDLPAGVDVWLQVVLASGCLAARRLEESIQLHYFLKKKEKKITNRILL
jgi:hypothetical protein